MRALLSVIIVLLGFIACNNTNIAKNSETIITVLQQLSPKADFTDKTVLLIPFDGCSTCFKEALNIIPNVIERNGLVIFTAIHKKRIFMTLEDNNIPKKMVIADTLQLIVRNRLVGNNPKLFIIRNNLVVYSKTTEYFNMDEIYAKLAK